MPKFRKKPIVIEARIHTGDLVNTDDLKDWMYVWDQGYGVDDDGNLYVDTLEGRLYVSIGDYLIKGVQNEFYACKPDIFLATYDAV